MLKTFIHLFRLIYSQMQLTMQKTITNIDNDYLSIIMQSGKTLHLITTNYGLKKLWKKILMFWWFVTMWQSFTNKKNIDLYCDDELWKLQSIPRTEIERRKKQIVKAFKGCGLSFTIEYNLKSVNFLDVTFDLVKDIYKLYCKPINKPIYINKHSNQPPIILKELPNPLKNIYIWNFIKHWCIQQIS